MHPSIPSGKFWEEIARRINRTMDYKVGTADGKSEGLQVLGIGEPWPIYLKEIEECPPPPRTSSDQRVIV